MRDANARHSKAFFSAKRVVSDYEMDLGYWTDQARAAFSEAKLIEHPEHPEYPAVSQRAIATLQLAQAEINALAERAKETMRALDASYQSPQKVVEEWLAQQDAEKGQPEPVTAAAVTETAIILSPVVVRERLNTDIAERTDALLQNLQNGIDCSDLIDQSEAAFAKAQKIRPDQDGAFATEADRNAYIEAAAWVQARQMIFNDGQQLAAGNG